MSKCEQCMHYYLDCLAMPCSTCVHNPCPPDKEDNFVSAIEEVDHD